MVKIYTGRVQYYHGPDKLDITVKSGIQAFAPTWPMVMNHKKGLITDQQYTEMYLEKMRQSYLSNKSYWEGLLKNHDKLVLCCYCKFGDFCHRHILAEILVTLAKALGIEASYEGEVEQ
jgi:uncharacterized protein YeaO (DUF488 family)